MKRLIFFIGFALIVSTGMATAAEWTINDQYYGGGAYGQYVQNDGDVISGHGSAHINQFDIDNMIVNIDDAGSVTVSVTTDYYANIARLGTDYGDLFISINGWNPTGTGP